MGLLYTRMKIFHFKEKLYSLPASSELVLPPLNVRIKPTNACNHNCWYCAYRSENLQLGQDMNLNDSIPLRKMLEIIDDLVEMGVKAVTFSGGGDPFCYQHLLATVVKLSVSPIKFAALTNGSRLTGEVAELFAHHATWLRISMDGWDDASYQKYRNCPDGEFTKIIQNMKQFKTLGGSCYLGVCIVVDKYNYTHVYDLIKVLKSTGIDSVKVSPCIISNDCNDNYNYHVPLFEKVKEQTERARKEFTSYDFELYDAYHYQLGTFVKNYSWCPYLQVVPVIGADLNIYACHDKAYNMKEGMLGSIKDTRFRDFWYSDISQFYRINPSRDCNHHCVVDSNNRMITEYLEVDMNHLDFM